MRRGWGWQAVTVRSEMAGSGDDANPLVWVDAAQCRDLLTHPGASRQNGLTQNLRSERKTSSVRVRM